MADKKLFGGEVVSTPTGSKLIAFGTSSSVAQNITVTNFADWVIDQIPPPPAGTLLMKVVNIGAYDMNGSTGNRDKELFLGVNRDKIRTIVVNILSNTGGIYSMASPAGNDELRSWWRVMTEFPASNAKIKLYSEDQSFFDQNAFDGNGPNNNRGYITIWYEA